MRLLKQAFGRLLATRAAAPLVRPLLRGRAAIVMLHRFRHPDLGVEGHDPVVLRSVLEALHRDGYEVLRVDALFRELAQGVRRTRPAVAFTIDDGYLDHAEVGAPAFAAFDMPVTTFVTSGFLDGTLWFWWDRIEHAFRATSRHDVSVALHGQSLSYAWTDAASRSRAQADFTARCKEVPDAAKHAAIAALAEALDVELPAAPPPRYAPMSWDTLRLAERGGMSFGPHTVTHPVLARADDAQSRHELAESWRRLREEAADPVPVFCYPNGRPQDFGDREIDVLRELGFLGAVTGVSGYASVADFASGDPRRAFHVRRFAYHEDPRAMLELVSGVERLKQIVRGQA